jgi:hypothetical protein
MQIGKVTIATIMTEPFDILQLSLAYVPEVTVKGNARRTCLAPHTPGPESESKQLLVGKTCTVFVFTVFVLASVADVITVAKILVLTL